MLFYVPPTAASCGPSAANCRLSSSSRPATLVSLSGPGQMVRHSPSADPTPNPTLNHSAASEAASQRSKGKYQKSKCLTNCHSERSEESRPFGKLGQALPRRQTRFLVAPLLGMTSSRKRRSCTLVVQSAQNAGGYGPGLLASPTLRSLWPLWLCLHRC